MRDVWRTYEHCYREYDQERSRSLMERPYLEELTARLESHTVLDLGCGMGEPIAKYFIDAGCKVTGVDASSVMIGLCRERYPEAEWIVEDMRRLSLAREFGAVIAWDSFFHLAQDEQRAMFSIFASHVQPRGLLLFTSGPRAGVAVGQFHGWPLFHSSLDPSEYRELLRNSGSCFSNIVRRILTAVATRSGWPSVGSGSPPPYATALSRLQVELVGCGHPTVSRP